MCVGEGGDMLVKEYGIPKEKSVAGANGICGIFTLTWVHRSKPKFLVYFGLGHGSAMVLWGWNSESWGG